MTTEELRALVKAANARYEALHPEEQAAHREAQRKSWVVGETMLANPNMSRADAEALYEQVR